MSDSVWLLRGGRIVDPGDGMDRRADIRFRNGVVAAVGTLSPEQAERVIDVDGLVVAPGLIDVHVHLREPGQEWKETIGAGTTAAAAGGFTRLFCMPNTEPALDSVEALEELARRVKNEAVVRVHPIAAISEGRRGVHAVDYDALARAGAVGFSDDGETTRDSKIMLSALAATRRTGVPVMVHCEDETLTGGAMHDGKISRELGIGGILPAAEELIIGRDLTLAHLTGGWLHVCHVTTAKGAELVAAAKANGTRVTAEVMPHHLVMNDAWVARQYGGEFSAEHAAHQEVRPDADAKVNPPLRPEIDASRLRLALRTGDIDIVATDHAPHGRHEKQGRTFANAAFGLSGSEFALPIMLSLTRSTDMTLADVISAMSATPGRLWGLDAGTLRVGRPADAVVFDPDDVWVVDETRLATRSANTPLLGMTLQGRVKRTFVGGEERYRDW